jgi:ABC-type siderophore export system fused ATPase/permease subunit
MQANMFLNKMQIPFYVAIGVLFAVEIVISILRGQGTDQYVAYVNIVLYLLVALVFTVFFIVTSIRVALFIKKVRKLNPKRKSLQKVSNQLWLNPLTRFNRQPPCWLVQPLHKSCSSSLLHFSLLMTLFSP